MLSLAYYVLRDRLLGRTDRLWERGKWSVSIAEPKIELPELPTKHTEIPSVHT